MHLSPSDAATPAQLFHKYIPVMSKISRASSIYCNINACRGTAKGNSNEKKQNPDVEKEKPRQSFPHADVTSFPTHDKRAGSRRDT